MPIHIFLIISTTSPSLNIMALRKKSSFKLHSKKAPTLKQKHRRTDKIIKADALNWKPVELPDHMDDYGGLYGIEELEGVDVKMVNGKAEFISKESGDEAEDDNDEFQGFDDIPEPQTKKQRTDKKENQKKKKR